MVFSLGSGDQFGNIVVAEPPAQSERARFGAVRFRGGGRKNFIQPHAQSSVDHFLEWFAQFGGALLCFGRNVRIKRQCGSHAGIMMLSVGKSTHSSRQRRLRLHLDERWPGRLKPSPGNFFVASMPSLLPLAISGGREQPGLYLRNV